MPRGERTPPGPPLYPECSLPGPTGRNRHAREGTRTCAHCRDQFRRYTTVLRLDKLAGRSRLVSTVGTRRRVQALARLGWTQRYICERVGITPSKLNKVICLHDKVGRELPDRIAALYRELILAEKLGPDQRVRRYAERMGWPGPFDWDDIDDPDAVPACEIERCHAEALAIEKLSQRREQRAQRTPEERDRDRAANRVHKEARRNRLMSAVAA